MKWKKGHGTEYHYIIVKAAGSRGDLQALAPPKLSPVSSDLRTLDAQLGARGARGSVAPALVPRAGWGRLRAPSGRLLSRRGSWRCLSPGVSARLGSEAQRG